MNNHLRGVANILWVHARKTFYFHLEMILCCLSKRLRIGFFFLARNCEDVIRVSYDAKTEIFQISINMTNMSSASITQYD